MACPKRINYENIINFVPVPWLGCEEQALIHRLDVRNYRGVMNE